MATKMNAAKNLLTSLGKNTKKKASVAPKSDRPEVELPVANHKDFTNFCAAKALGKLVDARVESGKETLTDVMFEKWTEALWNGKARPANPSITLTKDGKPDCTAIFQIKDRSTVGNPFPVEEDDESLEDTFKRGFKQIFQNGGVAEQQAEEMADKLVDNEFLLSPDVSVNLKKLLVGDFEGIGKNRRWVDATDDQKAIGAKIISLLQRRPDDVHPDGENELVLLTDEEMSQCLVQKDVMQVKKGLLERIAGYVNSLDQLRAVLAIVKPTPVFQPVKFAVSDSPQQVNNRLLEYATVEILGIKK